MTDTSIDTSALNIVQQFVPHGLRLPNVRLVRKSLVVAGIPGEVVYTLDSSNTVRLATWNKELLQSDTINFRRIFFMLTSQFGRPNFTRQMFSTWIRGDRVIGLADDQGTLYLISTDSQTFANRKELLQLRCKLYEENRLLHTTAQPLLKPVGIVGSSPYYELPRPNHDQPESAKW